MLSVSLISYSALDFIMLTRQQIIKTIRNIHRRGEPLNITAVKRRHPEIIQAVYAVKPFWGWKQALNDAGIDCAKIKVELQKYINCALCDKPMRNLANHLIMKHGVKPDDYLKDYPDSELQSETLRSAKMIRNNRFLRHWEPVWSREYILDRLAEYHRQGYSMNYTKLCEVDTPLASVAYRYLGSGNCWGKALTAIGLDPRKLMREARRQCRRYSDKEAVMRGIKQRIRKGLRVNYSSLNKDPDTKQRDVGLLRSGIEFWGSWKNALKAAGVDMEEALKRKRKYQAQEDIINEIRARHKLKWPITFNKIMWGENRDCMLGIYGREYFGSWNNALKAAGFEPVDVYNQVRLCRCKYPNAKSVLKAINQRIKERRVLNYTGVAFGHDRDLRLILGAGRLFGSWNNALKAAGLDPSKIKQNARYRAARRRCRKKK